MPEFRTLTSATPEADTLTLHDYLRVVRRRKWVVLLALLIVPLLAVAFSLHQQKRYEASADVLLNSETQATTVAGIPQSGLSEDPVRITETQAEVARGPEVVRNALSEVRSAHLTVGEFLADSSVSSSPASDILTFAVTSPDPTLATELANAYARAYSDHRQQLYTNSIERALADVQQRLRRLDRSGATLQRTGGAVGALNTYTSLYASLIDRQQTLESMQALQGSAASVLRRADGAVLTQPKTLRNGALGLVVGLVLGLAVVFLREALETRVRTAEEISARLGGLPLLGRVPRPPKRLRRAGRLVMIEEPASHRAEAFRIVRANLDFVTLDAEVRTIMVTSALRQEGRSTTIANVAIALARAGKHVVLVDLDMRRPVLGRVFGVHGPGLTDVVLGHVPLEEALTPIALTDPPSRGRRFDWRRSGTGNGALTRKLLGQLEVLPSGPVPPDPGEFVSSPALGSVLHTLRERADVVLVDAPQALQIGDVITLSSRVDGIVVVARSKALRRQTLADLNRVLAPARTRLLGLVVTGEGEGEGESYAAVGLASDRYRVGSFEPVSGSSGAQSA
jgi:Mrp family chromosome partitioning ATPase/capsular polysaccharide biosynthesis protein